ncbi:MAG: hypothetical protein ABIH53_00015 [archaeon]
MEEKITQGHKFYIDDLTRELSEKYDVNAFKGFYSILGMVEDEIALGRLMFLAKIAGEFIGATFETYRIKFPNDKHYPLFCEPGYSYMGADGKKWFQIYIDHSDLSHLLRREKINDETIYFPTERLVKAMMKGIELDFNGIAKIISDKLNDK